ncbi:hypothetical protein HNY73_005185 [Argiope bruennichi]|uniref:Uncharacterized protein n=1 Tax=Argiope bruennichi TaxID=94029 RepID=A0A8T0FI44_ARGBR|nr:hypothetical protein HNY73_005185 [Argiope bruennichi]
MMRQLCGHPIPKYHLRTESLCKVLLKEINQSSSAILANSRRRMAADTRRMLLQPVICSICHWHHLKMFDIQGKCREVRISSQRENSLSADTKIYVSLLKELLLDRRFIKSTSPEQRKSSVALTYFRRSTLHS